MTAERQSARHNIILLLEARHRLIALVAALTVGVQTCPPSVPGWPRYGDKPPCDHLNNPLSNPGE